ncbi:MAG: hypothetical protein ABWX90_02505 [Candidatus Saccharimonadales bacterium]
MAYVTVEDHIWPEGITEKQKKIINIKGYYKPTIIQGKLCALFQNYPDEYLVVGIGTDGTFEREYLFKDNPSACAALDAYTNLNEHPSGPWVKCEGVFNGEFTEIPNPNTE